MGSAVVVPVHRFGDRGGNIKDHCPCRSLKCLRERRNSIRVGKKRVEKLQEISNGSGCKVYKARFYGSEEVFALKIYDMPARRRRECKREVSVLQKLTAYRTESVFVVQPVFIHQQKLIAIEYCAGGDLADLLAERVPELEELRRFALEIACGLSFLHSRMIIHEDLKPANIGLTADHHIRIFDFGLSEILDEQSVIPSENAEKPCSKGMNEVISRHGTPPYACPEKLRMLPHGFEADWWSYGVVMYELLTGRVPWLGRTAEETCKMICEDPLSTPESIRIELDPEALCFVHDLIGSKEPQHRLGFGGVFREFEVHPFFHDVDFRVLL